jgi:hypothetical protein
MIPPILNPKKIELATVRIQCDDKNGTAFFVFIEENKQLLLTAEHNVCEEHPILVNISSEIDTTTKLLKRIPELDIAILETNIPDISNLTSIPLQDKDVAYNESWETFGFPALRITSGGRYTGTVSRTEETTQWDIDLDCEQYTKIDDFKGLSGAPLVIDGYVVGVIGHDNVGTLGASSVRNVVEVLRSYNIPVAVDKSPSITHSIKADVQGTNPNNQVLDTIKETISREINSSYFLISGSPGSGKTTIAAQLELEGRNQVILDRFFIKVPESDEYPTQIRATPEFFLQWVEEVFYRTLYGTPSPKHDSETTLNKRLLKIYQLLQELSISFRSREQVALIIIDGLDDVRKDKIEDFLQVFPESLPSNFKIIFSCTSKEVLPNSIRAAISPDNEIVVTPLPMEKVKSFIREQLEEEQLTYSQIQELAEKSEGHPLYLRYLIKYIIEADITSINDWLSSIPVIGGKIERYYNSIWEQLQEHTNGTWLAATLARLRVPIQKELLPNLLPSETQHHFLTSFKKIQHLLRDRNLISIYHTSFSDFMVKKTKEREISIHRNISAFTLNKDNLQSNFSISERIHHLIRGDQENKKKALEECNQSWVDDCALSSVNPDIVLVDIKETIGLAAGMGVAHKVIALLLLSQRVSFRYNVLFEENAFFLVNALLALNKPEEAIRYAVRNKTLVTAEEDALYLLQRFYEIGAEKEGEILFDAIERLSNKILEGGLNSESFERAIPLKIKAVALYATIDPEDTRYQFRSLLDVAIRIIRKSDNDEEVVRYFEDQVCSYYQGYLIYQFELPTLTRSIEQENTQSKFGDKYSGSLALSIYHALIFNERSLHVQPNNSISEWIEDLEYAIDKYGIHPDYYYQLLYILLEKSSRIDLIQNLSQLVFSNEPAFNLRQENGVDLDRGSIEQFAIEVKCSSFLDLKKQLPKLSNFSHNPNGWEEDVKARFQYLCLLNGKVKRYRADGENEKVKSLLPQLNNLLEYLIPDLKSRVYWERSYGLAEAFYPLVYSYLLELLIDAFPKEIPALVANIEQKKNYQLGLYTEGYINSLFVIATKLTKSLSHKISAFKTTKVLEEHIIETVENRWDRNEYLLRLVELYAMQGNKDRALTIFKEMINTSMGPSWYKEAQLGIINTTMSSIIPQNDNQNYLQKFATHLHAASGEMTFQRYIRQQQEEFIGDLTQIGFLDKAISYFKYLVLPDYKTILHNAESSKADMAHTGNGYILGARAIEEQSGILSLLQNRDNKGSLIAWSIAELFILGDDRYIRGYSQVQANILNYVEANYNYPNHTDILFKRFSKFVITEVSSEYRNEYIREISNELTPSNLILMRRHLEGVGMKSFSKAIQNNLDNPDTSSQENDTEDPLNQLIKVKQDAQEKLDTENKSGARNTIIEGLRSIQKQNYGVWSSNYSNKINDVRGLLLESYNNSSELIKDLKELIVDEPYFEEWVIASQLIGLLQRVEDEDEKQLIITTVLEHIELMVRTPSSTYEKYTWLGTSIPKATLDEEENSLLELLIWFLNHPSLSVKNRTIELLTWLGTVTPEMIVRALISEIKKKGYTISKELSASIIHQIADVNPTGFAGIIKSILEQNQQEILSLSHFMIKNSLLDSLKGLKSKGATNLNDLITKFEQTFITATVNSGDIIIDDEYLQPIHSYLDELNKLGVLNRKFAVTFFDKIRELIPLKTEESIRASEYIDRSFNNYNDIELISDFATLLRYVLNSTISSHVSLSNKESVADILRFYQPIFPENKIQVQFDYGHDQFEEVAKELFAEEDLDLVKFFLDGDIPLNYYSHSITSSETFSSSFETISLTSYLVPLNDFSEKLAYFPYQSFPSNSYPFNQKHKSKEIFIPLFITSGYNDNTTGSFIVPDQINPDLDSFITDNVKSTYWRKGRLWTNKLQGIPEKTGYFTIIPEDIVSTLKETYKLIWHIKHEYKSIWIDFFENKKIK